MKKIILTWWTHTWKTSILNELSSKWYTVIGEVAQKNMQTLIKLLGKENYQKWRKENFLEFQKMNIFDNLKIYFKKIENPKDWLIFYDRWVFDWIASLKREWYNIPNEIDELIKKIHYEKIFIIEHLDNHNTRNETGRILNLEISKKWEIFIKQTYLEKFWEKNIIIIPNIKIWDIEKNIEERTKIILNFLNNL